MSKSREEALADLPSISGWRPPIVYDISTDSWRPVTQSDVDKWQRLENTYGRMLAFLRAEHETLVKALNETKAPAP